jgi:phosphonate transport system substrate-binding protein
MRCNTLMANGLHAVDRSFGIGYRPASSVSGVSIGNDAAHFSPGSRSGSASVCMFNHSAGVVMTLTKRGLLVATASVATGIGLRRVQAQTTKLRFGVGPLLPSPTDTVKAYTPIFDHLAKQLGAEYTLVSTTDWAGMAVAMGSGQLDVAWMGPWGYIIANNHADCTAIATAKYDERPIYFAIVIAKPDLKVAKFPDDTKGMSMSFADIGSTSGWLIPTYYAKEVWKIDPKSFWAYHEGSTHAANEIAVSSGQIDLATDFDRNRTAMIESGKVKPDANKIVWTSEPLPNDAIVVPKGTSSNLVQHIVSVLTAITPDQARELLPPHYTGFIASNHSFYTPIEKAGLAVGKIKAKV